jgi:hypothetical protein
MIRSAAGKVVWLGRATVFLVGLAVILALVFGAATTALGANGKPFLLGKRNVASAVSTLVKRGPGPALSVAVGAGQAPISVNASAGKATNLNADELDGLDSSELRRSSGVYAVSEVHEGLANTTTFDAVGCDAGDEVLAGGYVGLSSGARVTASMSQSNGTEWIVGLESGPTAGSVNMFAECYDFPPAHVGAPPPPPPGG